MPSISGNSNSIPWINMLGQTSTPVAPASGRFSLYFKNGVLAHLNSAGVETLVTGGGGGGLTSVGLVLPSIFSVAGSPLTTNGSITATFVDQNANLFFAAPDGTSGAPSFRAIVVDDIPSLPASKIGSGSLALARGGFGADVSTANGYAILSGGTASFVKVNRSASAAPTTSNDTNQDYDVGSYWFDVTNDDAYVCLDATANSAIWKKITTSGSGSTPYAHFTHQLSQNTSGGTGVNNTWTNRALNTTVTDNIGITLSSNVLSIPAGTYEIDVCSNFFIASSTTFIYTVLRLQDTTNNTTLLNGLNNGIQAGGTYAVSQAKIKGRFTLTSSSNVAIQYRTNIGNTTHFLGYPANIAGRPELYTSVELWKVG